MYEDPHEGPDERALDPKRQAEEKSDEFRMHAQLAAVFEATRKFAARIHADLDADRARDIQRTMAKLEKAKAPESPILLPPSAEDAARLLDFAQANDLATNDYHIYRRPGEAMIVRWLAGEQVESFYQRMQAHFDVALTQFREEEHQSNAWRQDERTLAHLKALDAIKVNMAERYLRDLIRQHNLYVLSTQAADELDILYLAEHVMAVEAKDLVGAPSAPPDDPTEQERAWFFKLFSLRGMKDGQERMCFFTYLQKTEEVEW